MPGPQQKRPFWGQRLEDILPPTNTDPFLGTGQQTWLERGLGIEKGSLLDTPSLSELARSLGQGARNVGQGMSQAWNAARQAPGSASRFEPQPSMGLTPASPPMFRPQPPRVPGLPDESMTMRGEGRNPFTEVPSSYDPNTVAPGAGVTGWDPNVQLNTESALSGLKNASMQRTMPRIPSSELYKQAAARPQTIGYGDDAYQIDTVAPGAREWAAGELGQRNELDDFQRLLGQKQQETVTGSQTALHPAVRAAEGERAERAALPAQITGRSNALASWLGLQGRQATADATVEASRSRRDQGAMQAVTRAIQELAQAPAVVEDPADRTERMGKLQGFQQILELIRNGQFFSYDDLNQVLGDDFGFGLDDFAQDQLDGSL